MDSPKKTVLILVAAVMVVLAGCSEASLSTPTPTSGQPDERGVEVTVVEVVDGDTMDIEYQNGTNDTIRLLGVDTPEVHIENDPAEFDDIPNTTAGRNHLRDWGHKASEFARTELAGETITIVVDDQADRRGYYGRLLVYVYDEGELFNLKLIQQGYARMYESTFSKRSQFSSAEADAQANNVGLWNYGGTTATTSGGESGLVVATVNPDAEGNDIESKNEENVVLGTRPGSRLALRPTGMG